MWDPFLRIVCAICKKKKTKGVEIVAIEGLKGELSSKVQG